VRVKEACHAGNYPWLAAVKTLEEPKVVHMHLIPVLLGAGRRLFETRDSNHIELQLIRRLEGRDATHLRYQVRPQGA
jgi:hypothetical protein